MIYLVRHGQTEFNAQGRLQGHVDSPLTEQGVAQAKAFGQTLARLLDQGSAWQIVSSPLGRAYATAGHIGQVLGTRNIETDPRLIELSWGDWDGRLRSELQTEHPDAFNASGWAFRTQMGETYEAVCQRMRHWLDSLPAEADRRVIAVSHGIAGRVLRGVYAGLSREKVVTQPVPQDAIFALSNGTITRIDCDPHPLANIMDRHQ